MEDAAQDRLSHPAVGRLDVSLYVRVTLYSLVAKLLIANYSSIDKSNLGNAKKDGDCEEGTTVLAPMLFSGADQGAENSSPLERTHVDFMGRSVQSAV